VSVGRIDVLRLAQRREDIAGEVTERDLPRLAERLSGASRIGFELRGGPDARGRPSARLSLGGEVGLRCDRCDTRLALPIEQEADFYFVADEAELERIPIDADEEAEPLVGSADFDLGALIEDEVVLALPISPRHDACEASAAAVEEKRAVDAVSEPTRRPFADLARMLGRKPEN